MGKLRLGNAVTWIWKAQGVVIPPRSEGLRGKYCYRTQRECYVIAFSRTSQRKAWESNGAARGTSFLDTEQRQRRSLEGK